MKTVGIIGATGYAGVELVRLLLRHPGVNLAAVGSVSFEGRPLAEVYPALREITALCCGSADEVVTACDIIFAAVPHGVSQELGARCLAAGKRLIDLGADFRLDDAAEYERWYATPYTHPEAHGRAVYGLPELFRADIAGADIVGNPGCYPTAVALGLAPALRAGLVMPDGIIIDAKSGVTGAGRGLSQNTHFPENNEAFAAYKVAAHRHTPEIAQTLAKAAGGAVSLTFVPHLLPVNRGILATVYARFAPGGTLARAREVYAEAYRAEPFVRLKPEGEAVNISHVRGSNYCDVQLYADEAAGLLIVTSVLDNMVKGAAGQAVQNMNLLLGLPEVTGLEMVPTVF